MGSIRHSPRAGVQSQPDRTSIVGEAGRQDRGDAPGGSRIYRGRERSETVRNAKAPTALLETTTTRPLSLVRRGGGHIRRERTRYLWCARSLPQAEEALSSRPTSGNCPESKATIAFAHCTDGDVAASQRRETCRPESPDSDGTGFKNSNRRPSMTTSGPGERLICLRIIETVCCGLNTSYQQRYQHTCIWRRTEFREIELLCV